MSQIHSAAGQRPSTYNQNPKELPSGTRRRSPATDCVALTEPRSQYHGVSLRLNEKTEDSETGQIHLISHFVWYNIAEMLWSLNFWSLQMFSVITNSNKNTQKSNKENLLPHMLLFIPLCLLFPAALILSVFLTLSKPLYFDLQDIQGVSTKSFHHPPAGSTLPPSVSRVLAWMKILQLLPTDLSLLK